MSEDIIQAVGENPEFTASEKAVLNALGWRDMVEHRAIPELARWTGLAPNTVRAALSRLGEAGCLSREIWAGKADGFELHLEAIQTYTKVLPLPKLVPLPELVPHPYQKREGSPTKNVRGHPYRKSKREKEAVVWETPEWFRPLTTLEGYRRLDYSKLATKLLGICEAAEVAPGDVVRTFAEYWPVGRIKHGWGSPVNALQRTITVQISKVKSSSFNGARASPGRGEHTPEEYAQAKRDYDERVRRAQQETST